MFTIHGNIEEAFGTYLQGVAVGEFVSGSLEVALSWHKSERGLQMITVPADPVSEVWVWREISNTSFHEGIDAADIDADGDLDLLLGTSWLRNDTPAGSTTRTAGPWTLHLLHETGLEPDRNLLADINADGRMDAVIGYEAIGKPGKLAWYEQPEQATDPWSERFIAEILGPMSVSVVDMDEDGDYDIVAGEHTKVGQVASLYLFENLDGRGQSWVSQLVSTGYEHHMGAQVVDLDLDGDKDVYSIGWTHSSLLAYENRFKDLQPTPTPTSTSTPMPSATVTASPSATLSASPSATLTRLPSATPSPTFTRVSGWADCALNPYLRCFVATSRS